MGTTWAERRMALLAHETRTTLGTVPRTLGGIEARDTRIVISQGCVLLRVADGPGYFYRPGDGITIEPTDPRDVPEEDLWLRSSVYSAVASLNGFMPIHASAVACGGQVFAFTGPSGA